MYDPTHMARLKKMKDLAPDAWNAFVEFDRKALAEGALSVKTKELIAVGVAHTTQCIYCIDLHVKKARKAGATDEELAETVLVAAALRAGGAIAHATHMLGD